MKRAIETILLVVMAIMILGSIVGTEKTSEDFIAYVKRAKLETPQINGIKEPDGTGVKVVDEIANFGYNLLSGAIQLFNVAATGVTTVRYAFGFLTT